MPPRRRKPLGFEQGYETSQALQARLATFLRGTAGWTVAVEQW